MLSQLSRRQFIAVPGALGLSALISSALASSCTGLRFPQLSGLYTLLRHEVSDPSFAGKKRLPANFLMTDRMEYVGNYWNHLVRCEFSDERMQVFDARPAAQGTLAFDLDDLTRINTGVYPNDGFDGVSISDEQKVTGGVFCYYQYQYYLSMSSVPSVEVLQRVYPTQGRYVGEDPVTKMPLYESLSNPSEVDFDPEEWEDAVDDNDGVTLKFTFTRHIKRQTPGWEGGYKDCILPSDPRKEAALIAVYHASPSSLYTEADIRRLGTKGVMDGAMEPAMFFSDVVSEMKL
ncbi:hypothetical protein HZB03_00600 [Candidatus Woesearchaeota archaeon]|nr:hypothetical protein [Candidatus Woesearchaeota archaeon]